MVAGLKHQLHERIPIVPAPDYYVASLLHDLGQLYAAETGEPAAGKESYDLALHYCDFLQERPIQVSIARMNVLAEASRGPWDRLGTAAPPAFTFWAFLALPLVLACMFSRRTRAAGWWRRALVLATTVAALIAPFWFWLSVLDDRDKGDRVIWYVCLVCALSVLLARMAYLGVARVVADELAGARPAVAASGAIA